MSGADKIIWDDAALRRVTALLRRASFSLDDCGVQLYHLRSDMQLMFGGKTGAVGAELQRNMDRCVRRLDGLRERTAGLVGAAAEAAEFFSATERSICRLAESLSVGSHSDSSAATAEQSRRLPRAIQTARLAGTATITPDWLERAADRYFSNQ